MTRVASASVVFALLAAGAANLAYLFVEPFDGMVGSDAAARMIATALAAVSTLAAGWLVKRLLARLLLTLAAILLLLAAGIAPVLAVAAPLLLALLSGLARDVAEVTADLPAVRARLLVFAAVGLGGPPVVALAHLFA